MAHVNAEKTEASQIKSVAGAGSAKMMGLGDGENGHGSMMKRHGTNDGGAWSDDEEAWGQ